MDLNRIWAMALRSIKRLSVVMDLAHSIVVHLRPCELRPVPHFDDIRAAGRYGERCAASWLRHTHGYKVLVANYRVRRGEIDLVCRHRDTLVFVEIKSRANETFGQSRLLVDRKKQLRLRRAIEEYRREIGQPDVPQRFDVVEVILVTGALPELRLLQDVRFFV